jgi:hypothetical protein
MAQINSSVGTTLDKAEAFNVFNWVRLGPGDLNLQDANFRRLTSSPNLLNTPRQLHLALKLYF